MKRNCEKILGTALAGMMLVGLLAPLLVLARAQSADSNATSTPKGSVLCNSYVGTRAKIDQRLTARDENLKEKRSEINSRIQERVEKRAEWLKEKRDKWDEVRAQQFAKLEEKALTDVQKEAVAAFKKAVTEAIAARRAAIDAANKSFQDGVKKAVSDRKIAIDGIIAAFRLSVKNAYEKAKADCASGVDAQTVRTNLRAALKAAKDKYNTDRQNLEKLKDTKDQLIATHRAAVKKAIDDFKAAMEKARADLKAVLVQPMISPSGSASPSPSASPSS